MAAYIISNQVEAVIQQHQERKGRRPPNNPSVQPGMPGAGAPPYRTDNM